MVRIGTAGWAIPPQLRDRFSSSGSQLARYSGRCNCVEINSTFRQRHRPATYARWAESVPESFAFSLKIPKEITHVRRLRDCSVELEAFLRDTETLGTKRAVLLVQLPPSLEYEKSVAEQFFAALRTVYDGFVVCEPRHRSWFTTCPNEALREQRVGRVAADPAVCESAAKSGGWPGIEYRRLHGSPRTYYSSYGFEAIAALGAGLSTTGGPERWTIFDNTAMGAALPDALELLDVLAHA